MSLAIRLLGPLELDVDGVPAELAGHRQRAVLAQLLIARGAVVSVDRLIDDLWRGEPPPRATGNLQVYISHLRRALEPARAPRSRPTVLISAPPGYALRVDDASVDLRVFEQLTRTASPDPAETAAALQRALALWRGEALAEFRTEQWAEAEAARLDELRLTAVERLADALVRRGDPVEAALRAESLVRDHPLREEAWRLLALAQYAAGRQGDALATLRRARSLLADELGLDPGPRLRDLERDVLEQTIELQTTRPVVEVRPAVAGHGPTHGTGSNTVFVGRTDELLLLERAKDAARPGRPGVALVSGEPGGGKSALLAQFRDRLLSQGWRVAVGRCPEDETGRPAWAWSQVFRSLAAEVDPGELADGLRRLLTDDEATPTASAVVDRYGLHRAAAEYLGARSGDRIAILLDDVHRADTETRALLRALLDTMPSTQVVFVLAFRPEADAGLDDLLASVAPHEPVRILLAGLSEHEVGDVLTAVTGARPDPVMTRALTERTDGNPFYLRETARLLASEGDEAAVSRVPAGVGDVLRRRLARLPEETVSVLRLASVIGRDVEIAVLVRSAELDEDAVLDALESGVISELLVEPAPGSVRFAHLLVRETLYVGTSRMRRVRWHARIADAIAELHPADVVARALHAASAATPTTAAAAADLCRAAAAHAHSRFSYDTEYDQLLEAQRCLELAPDPDRAALVAVLADQVPALMRVGGTAHAIEVRRAAIALAAGAGDPLVSARAVTAGSLPLARGALRQYGELDLGIVELAEQLLTLDVFDDLQRFQLMCTIVKEAANPRPERAEPHFLAARELARRMRRPDLVLTALYLASDVYTPDLRPTQFAAVLDEIHQLVAEQNVPDFAAMIDLLNVEAAGGRLDFAAARGFVERGRRNVRRFQLRQGEFLMDMLDGMLVHIGGDPDRAEQLFVDAVATQGRRGTVDAQGTLLLATTAVRYTQGRLAELADALAAAVPAVPAVAHFAALALVEARREDEARAVLARSPEPARDFLWTVFTCYRGLAAAALGDRGLGERCYAGLLPLADRLAGATTIGFAFAPVAEVLGRLADAFGSPQDAQQHYAQALQVARICGSQPWQQRIREAAARRPAGHSRQ